MLSNSDSIEDITPWRVHLLGGFHIQKDGSEVPPPPYRCQTLLAALLLNPSSSRREILAGRFFPDLPEEQAKARLSDRLWLLKKHLPGFPFLTTTTEIAIAQGNIWVDAIAFRNGVKKGSQHDLAEAVTLYAGDLLPEHYDDWLLIERESLFVLYSRSLKQLAKYYSSRGESQSAIPFLEKLNQIEPLDEGNLRDMLRAYQAAGRRGAAMAMYERFVVDLRNEMALEPELATQAIVKALQTQALPCRSETIETIETHSPLDLLQRCQQAVLCGDFCLVSDGLKALRKTHPPEVSDLEIDLLEIDLAMNCGDYPLANRLISRFPEPALSMRCRAIHLALEEKNHQRVIDLTLPILLESHGSQDTLLRSILLTDLALAKQEQAETREAVLYVNQAINIALEADLAYANSYAQYAKGIIVSKQGLEIDAIQILHQAASFARDHAYRPLLARIELELGINYRFSGKFNLSIQHLEDGLSVSRDLGLQRVEAEILQELAAVYDCLGQGQKSLVALEAARSIYQALDDELGLARNMYHLAFGMAAHEHDGLQLDRALDIANQALAILEKRAHLAWSASTYSCIGYIEWLRKNPRDCIEAYQNAISIHEKLNEMDYIPEMYGYIGLGYLEMGQYRQALENTTHAMSALTRSDLHDIGSEIYFAHASVLAALGRNEEADDYFTRAYQNLLKYAQDIEDSAAREAFFQRDPTVRCLMEQVYTRGIAPGPHLVASVMEPHLKLAIRVSLTIDAGASDQVLKKARGKIALRRERMARIQRESRSQGIKLSPRQIADLMGVSLRTVQRDMESLLAGG
jgi:DNA-binding SARP family transcriptional activator